MKIFKFRRFVQRKLLLSPLRPTATPHPLFVRHSASYPRPNYIHPSPSTYPSALFTARADIQMPSRLYPSAWALVVHHHQAVSLHFFFPSRNGRGNCLLSFEIVALPLFCCLISWLISRSPFASILLKTRCSGKSLCSLHRSMKTPEDAANYKFRSSFRYWCTKCPRLSYYLFFISSINLESIFL